MIGILGSGSWATALAKILTDNGQKINWWMRQQATIDHINKRHHNQHYLSSANFDVSQLHMDNDLQTVINKSEIVLICIPSAYILPLFSTLPTDIFKGKKIISAIKGVLPNDKHQLLNEYLQEVFSVAAQNYYSIMGPCHAEEVAAEKLSYLTFSGTSKVLTQQMATYFQTWYLNTVVNQDIWGCQYAAVLKNIYAVGAGIAHGLEYGDNFLSVYIANAANEMVEFLKKISVAKNKLAVDAWQMAAVVHPETAVADGTQISALQPVDLHIDLTTANRQLSTANQGPPSVNYASSVYLGDLLVTCYSLFSRNRTFGNMIGKGYSVKVAQLEMNMVAEGYPASKGMYETNETVGADMPIAATIYKILWEGMEAAQGFEAIEAVLQ